MAANFLLLHEHYLDLTNVFEMHAEMVPPGIEALPPLEEVEISEVSVSYARELPKAPLAPWEAAGLGPGQRRVVRPPGDGHLRDARAAQADLHHHQL